MPRRVLIMGAAGRDFHNFNVVYRDDRRYEVVAFTATQIPFIDDRTYPASLAGQRYPNGIQIHEEADLTRLIRDLEVDDVVFAYSDVSHEYVMHKGSEVLAAGANVVLFAVFEITVSTSVGPNALSRAGLRSIPSKRPVIAVAPVRISTRAPRRAL